MNLIKHDCGFSQLSALIGAGLQNQENSVLLEMKESGGEGLLWTISIMGKHHNLWCSEQQWCNYIAPQLSVQEFSDVPPALLNLLASWSTRHWMGIVDAELVSVQRGGICNAIRPHLCLRGEDSPLSWCLQDWPEETMLSLIRFMKPASGSGQEPVLWQSSLQIGWSDLTFALLKELKTGDGLVLRNAPPLTENYIWMDNACSSRMIVRKESNDEFIVESIMSKTTFSDTGETANEAICSLSDIGVQVVFELGRVTMPLHQLSELRAGDCFSAESEFDQQVNILLHGKRIGRGALLQSGQSWIVRIEQLADMSLAHISESEHV